MVVDDMDLIFKLKTLLKVLKVEIGKSISEYCNFMQFPSVDSFSQNVFNDLQ